MKADNFRTIHVDEDGYVILSEEDIERIANLVVKKLQEMQDADV